MSAVGNTKNNVARVEAVLRSPDAAPWVQAPEGLRDRVMASLDAAPSRSATQDSQASWSSMGWWRPLAAAASVAIIAGGLGVLAGALAWRSSPADHMLAEALPESINEPSEPLREITTHEADRPVVVLARAFDDLRPAGSSRLMASVAAPMRTEAEGLASETRLAARTVLSRLPFVSME